MNMNNFIGLTPNDIIIYNHIQSKIYKYFILHHKKYNFIIDDNNNNDDDITYCKNFKFNVCLCYRNKNNINNYSKIYNCPNNKRILYNTNNFNFLNPISVSINNEKIYPIDIFTYYRQEYLPFIINEKFIKYKNNQSKLIKFNKKKLLKTFNIFKYYQNNHHFLKYNFNVFKKSYIKSLNKKICISYNNTYNNNSYYNDLIDVFNSNPISKNISTQTEEQPTINYSLIIAIILNDYTNLIGDYNDFIISLLKH